jgi:hypothetical protein
MQVRLIGLLLPARTAFVLGLLAQSAAAATVTVSSTGDDTDGDTSSIANLIANPGPDGTISLREALLAANNTPGPNTISFAPALAGQTIALTNRFAPITRDGITITGPTSNGQPNITINPSAASNPGAVLFIAASSFTMTGVRFSSIPSSFNGIQIGGSGFDLMGHQVDAPAQITDFNISGNSFSNGTGLNTFAIFVSHTINVTHAATISNVTIANNTFTNLFEAINVQGGGSNNVIQDVVIFGNTFSQMTANATSAVELGNMIGSSNQIRRTQIVQNVFTGNLQGIALDNNGTGSVIDDTLIARNVFSGNQAAISPIVGGTSAGATNNTITNTRIINNLVNRSGFGGQSGGVAVRITDNDQGATNNTVNGVSIVNNTFFGPGPDGSGIWVTSNTGGVSGVSTFNTIFWGNGGFDFVGMTSAQVQYSITAQPGFAGMNNNLNADPLFVNSGTGDFHLQPGSPTLGAGTSNSAPTTDLDCRPRGSPPSIGAYEFNGPNICKSIAGGWMTNTHDLNADGFSDVLWRNTSGQLALWFMNGAAISSATGAGTVTTDWTVVGQRDFNGDGFGDILWRQTGGQAAIWLMNGATLSGGGGLGMVSTDWAVAGTGDFNGDGRGDVLWRNTTSGQVAIWLVNGTTILAGSGSPGTVTTDWVVAGTGDFNGDSKTDILWRNTTTGQAAIWLMNGASILSGAGVGIVTTDWIVTGTGDFDGDGKSDILWRNTTSGQVAMWFMSGTTVAGGGSPGSVPTAWTIVATGDFNNDGKSDLLWHDTSGNTAVWLMNGATILPGSASLGNVVTSWTIQGANAD